MPSQLPISSTSYGHLSLSHSSCGGKARLAPSLKAPPSSPVRSALSRAVPPDPQGKPTSPHCPVLPSDPFVSWATHPTFSLCPLASPSHPLIYGTSVRRGLKGRYSNLIRGPLFREKRRSFARDPLTPSARPGSIRPLSGTRLSHLPLARPMRFAPFRLPQGRLPRYSVSRRPSVATSGPRLFLDHLPALAWKTLFGGLRGTYRSRRPQGLPRPSHAQIRLIA